MKLGEAGPDLRSCDSERSVGADLPAKNKR